MNRNRAKQYLYDKWENGELPSNFTEDHTQYEDAIAFLMENNYYYFNSEL